MTLLRFILVAPSLLAVSPACASLQLPSMVLPSTSARRTALNSMLFFTDPLCVRHASGFTMVLRVIRTSDGTQSGIRMRAPPNMMFSPDPST